MRPLEFHPRGRANGGKRRTSPRRRPDFDRLEGRRLLAPPRSPSAATRASYPADFRVTTFATGLNYPSGMAALSDGSILVGRQRRRSAGSYFNSPSRLIRLVDGDGDGVADGPGTVLYDGLPGGVTTVRVAGEFVLVTDSQAGAEGITVLQAGATPADPLTLAGAIHFSFPSGWEHTTYATAVRPTPGSPGEYDVFFNIGSEFNGIKKDAQGNSSSTRNGHAIPDPTTGSATASGLLSATLAGDSVYKVTLQDVAGTPALSGLTKVATGLRNAASLAVDPATGDLLLADNGIDGTNSGTAAWSTDTLQHVPSADMGVKVDDFGYPYDYSPQPTPRRASRTTRVDLLPPRGVVAPIASFQPLADPNLPASGSESEGASGFAARPVGVPGRSQQRGLHRVPRAV